MVSHWFIIVKWFNVVFRLRWNNWYICYSKSRWYDSFVKKYFVKQKVESKLTVNFGVVSAHINCLTETWRRFQWRNESLSILYIIQRIIPRDSKFLRSSIPCDKVWCNYQRIIKVPYVIFQSKIVHSCQQTKDLGNVTPLVSCQANSPWWLDEWLPTRLSRTVWFTSSLTTCLIQAGQFQT